MLSMLISLYFSTFFLSSKQKWVRVSALGSGTHVPKSQKGKTKNESCSFTVTVIFILMCLETYKLMTFNRMKRKQKIILPFLLNGTVNKWLPTTQKIAKWKVIWFRIWNYFLELACHCARTNDVFRFLLIFFFSFSFTWFIQQ